MSTSIVVSLQDRILAEIETPKIMAERLEAKRLADIEQAKVTLARLLNQRASPYGPVYFNSWGLICKGDEDEYLWHDEVWAAVKPLFESKGWKIEQYYDSHKKWVFWGEVIKRKLYEGSIEPLLSLPSELSED